MRIGILGRAGRLAERALAAGLEPVVVGAAPPGCIAVETAAVLGECIDYPRVHLLDLAAGPEVDTVLDAASATMEPGDVVVDLSGSYWGDTLRRWRRMRHRSLFHLDAALLDTALIVAGDTGGVAIAEPALRRLAAPLPLINAGAAAAAHYALMVEDAWRTARREAALEVRQALEAFPGGMTAAVAARMTGAEPGPAPRAAWLLDDAVRLQAALPLLAQAVMLDIAGALDQLRPQAVAPRLGGFIHPDEVG